MRRSRADEPQKGAAGTDGLPTSDDQGGNALLRSFVLSAMGLARYPWLCAVTFTFRHYFLNSLSVCLRLHLCLRLGVRQSVCLFYHAVSVQHMAACLVFQESIGSSSGARTSVEETSTRTGVLTSRAAHFISMRC